MTFFVRDKGNRRFPGLAKMWVEWSVGGVADLAKRNPEPPTGGGTYTPCYAKWLWFLYFSIFCFNQISNSFHFLYSSRFI
jgi:hypothetical protein